MEQIRVALREGRLDDAWAAFQDAPPNAEVLLLGSLVARALYRKSAGPDASDWLHRAHGLIESACDRLRGPYRLLHAEVYYQRARVELDMGDSADAHHALQWLLTHGPRAAGATWGVVEPGVHYFLGLTYRLRREPMLSMHHYLLAVDAGKREGQRQVVLDALQNAAWLCLLDGNAERAEQLVDEAEALATTELARWRQGLRRAFIASLRGDLEGAMRQLRDLYATATEQAKENRDAAEVCAWACWLSARISLTLGAFGPALQFCRDGSYWVLWGGDTRVMTALGEVRAAATDAMNAASD